MGDPSDIFHFPRTAEAALYLESFETGSARAFTLFGPRRIGKARFLLRDLAPMAEKRKIKTAYVSFWQNIEQPARALENEIAKRLKARTSVSVAGLLRTLEAEATIRSPDIPGAPSASATVRRKPATTSVRQDLETLFDQLCGPRTKALFLFDEVQQLALSSAHDDFTAALRSALDRRENAFAVFTGSSESGLNALFSHRLRPMFNFGNRIELEPLGADFIAHQAIALSKRGVRVSQAKLKSALEALQGRPYEFELFRNRLMRQRTPDVDAALERTLSDISDYYGFPVQWDQLSALSKATLRVIAAGETQPHSEEARARVGKLLHAPAPDSLQGALRALVKSGVLQQFEKRGPYEYVDPAFADWVRRRPD